MFWNRTSRSILPRWQDDLSHCIELGRSPIFYLGRSDAALDGLLGVQTLSHFAQHNRAVTAPRVLMGGESALWLFASLHSRSVRGVPRSVGRGERRSEQPETMVVFTGVDPATHMASIGIAHAPNSTSFPAEANTNGGPMPGLPRSMAWLYAPVAEPASDAPWSAVPFLWAPAATLQARAVNARPAPFYEAPSAEEASAVEESAQSVWLAWGSILLVASILITALFG